MSDVKDFLFGSKGSAPEVINVTPRWQEDLHYSVNQLLDNLIKTPVAQGLDPHQGESLGVGRPYGEDMVAPLSPTEQNYLDAIAHFGMEASPQLQAAMDQLTRQASGVTNPLMAEDSLAGQFITDLLSGSTLNPDSNPWLQASIESAQRPIMEAFGDELSNVRGAFTAAGHRVQPQSSSPFDTARARLVSGVSGALGDVATNIMSQHIQQERNRQMQALGLMGSAFEQGEQRALDAARAVPSFDLARLEGIIASMEAQALPRMIEQYGIDRGVEEFRRQQSELLNVLQMAIQAAGGAQYVSTPGTEGGGGMLAPILGGVGAAVGGPLGSALGGAIGGAFSRGDQPAGGGTINLGSLGAGTIPVVR